MFCEWIKLTAALVAYAIAAPVLIPIHFGYHGWKAWMEHRRWLREDPCRNGRHGECDRTANPHRTWACACECHPPHAPPERPAYEEPGWDPFPG